MTADVRGLAATMDVPTETTDRDVEARWIERARRGDREAYDWIVTRYRERAVRLAAHVLRRPDEAEDAVQEAFVRALRRLSSFRGDGAFYTWLYAVIVNVCINRLRADRRHPSTVMAERADPADRLSAVEDHLLIETLMDRLTPPMRSALTLRELEGLDYEEIATILTIPVGTVRSRLSTARKQFIEMWQAAAQESNHV